MEFDSTSQQLRLFVDGKNSSETLACVGNALGIQARLVCYGPDATQAHSALTLTSTAQGIIAGPTCSNPGDSGAMSGNDIRVKCVCEVRCDSGKARASRGKRGMVSAATGI